jgi:hypothetical protein
MPADIQCKILYCSFVFEYVKTKICRTLILPFVFHGCKNLSVTLGKEHGLRVFENRVLRRIFGPIRDEVKEESRGLHSERIHDLYSTNMTRMVKSQRQTGVACCTYERWEVQRGSWWEKLREGDHLQNLAVDKFIIFKWILEMSFGSAWNGLVWHGKWIDGGLLWRR